MGWGLRPLPSAPTCRCMVNDGGVGGDAVDGWGALPASSVHIWLVSGVVL